MRGGWDVHTHLLPEDIAERAKAGDFGMRLGDGVVEVHGFKLQLGSMGRPGALLERIERDGLDGAVAAVPPPLFRADQHEAERRDYVNWLNAGLLRTTSVDKRLKPMAYLPTDLPDMAFEVAFNLSADWAGVIVGTDLGGNSYADAIYYRLWALLADRNLPVLIHPSESKDPRLTPFYLSNLLGNPMETTLAAAQMIFGDIPAKFPDLKVILSHGGGAMAQLLGRWQRGLDTERPGVKPLASGPVAAAGWFYADTIVHSEAVLELLLKTIGPDHLLLGSDWPFPMGAPSADHDLKCLSATLREKIRIGNALTLFGS